MRAQLVGDGDADRHARCLLGEGGDGLEECPRNVIAEGVEDGADQQGSEQTESHSPHRVNEIPLGKPLQLVRKSGPLATAELFLLGSALLCVRVFSFCHNEYLVGKNATTEDPSGLTDLPSRRSPE